MADLLLKNIQCITELPSGYAGLETAAVKRQFRQSFFGRHYLVLADGFYEWKTPTTDASNPTTS
jgi:putative SOS response-associated peptidase YedK